MMKMIGISDENTTCDCCGKTNLKRTVVMDTETGIKYYGSNCAASALRTSKKVVDNRAEITAFAQGWLGKASPAKIAVDINIRFGVKAECKGGILYIGNWGAIPFRKA